MCRFGLKRQVYAPDVENFLYCCVVVDNPDKKAYFAGMDVLPLLNEMASAMPEEKRENLKKNLAACLNELLLHDFAALVQLLYRVDVSEKKLKAVLQDNPGKDAGDLLAGLLLERQQEKIAAKNQFRFPTDASEEERW
jgi:hypothetical protein